VICGPHQLLVFLRASIIWFLMITLILCGLFLCTLNLTLFPHCQIFLPLFPRSLATPSKPSSVTTGVSLAMSPPVHSLPLLGLFCGCLAYTPLCRTVKPSVSGPHADSLLVRRAPHRYVPTESPLLQGNQRLLPVCLSLRRCTLI
jgi:hypothetical protein